MRHGHAGAGRPGTMAACAAAMALVLWASTAGVPVLASGPRTPPGMVHIPGGTYLPLYAPPAPADKPNAPRQPIAVGAFDMDVYAVTNAQYLEFVRAHPEWRRSQVRRLFADASYLHHWRGDLDPGDQAPPTSPVVYVSWFAARAYLASVGKTLPTVDEWEYVAAGNERKLGVVVGPEATSRNKYGVRDLGLVWEWALDFNSALVTGESRADSALDRSLFCGSGAVGASNFEDYAAFMRFAFRASLEARYTVSSLGFRGVIDADHREGASQTSDPSAVTRGAGAPRH